MTEKRDRTTISGRDASQGYTVLNTPLRKTIFIGGLVGIVVLSLSLFL